MRWPRRTPGPIAETTVGRPAGAPEDLEHLHEWLFGLTTTNPQVQRTAQVIGRLLRDVPASRLSRLDGDSRHWTRFDDGGWRRLRPDELRQLIRSTNDALGVAAAASMHHNGYVREAAVAALGDIDTGPELRWLLLRAVDWVDPVRQLATQLVRDRLDSANRARYAPWLVDALPLIIGQRFAESTSAADLRAALNHVFADPSLTAALWSGLHHEDRAVRRGATLTLAAHTDDALRLLHEIPRDDAVAIDRIARITLANAATCELAADYLARSPIARARAAALWHLTHHEHDYARYLTDALGDRSGAVRDVAQRVSYRDGGDPLTYYRHVIDETPLIALLGLGDIGNEDDADLALRYVHDPSRIGIAATRVVARKGGARHLPTLIDLAFRHDGGRADEAVRGLARHGIRDELAELAWSAAVNSTPARQRRMIARIVSRANRWTRLQIGLRAASTNDHDLQGLGVALVNRTLASWNSSASRPTERQLGEIRVHLSNGAPGVDRQVANDLIDLVRYW